MSLLRHLSAGRLDGDAIRARLRATEAAGDDRLWEQLMSSIVGRAGARLIDITTRAAADSIVVTALRTGYDAWPALPAVVRFRALGLLILTAVATHLVMTASTPTPGAWRFLLPGLAATFGVVALGLSYFGPREPGTGD